MPNHTLTTRLPKAGNNGRARTRMFHLHNQGFQDPCAYQFSWAYPVYPQASNKLCYPTLYLSLNYNSAPQISFGPTSSPTTSISGVSWSSSSGNIQLRVYFMSKTLYAQRNPLWDTIYPFILMPNWSGTWCTRVPRISLVPRQTF